MKGSTDLGEVAYHFQIEEVGDGRLRYRVEVNESTGRRVWVGDAIPRRLRHLTTPAGILPVLEQAEEAEE